VDKLQIVKGERRQVNRYGWNISSITIYRGKVETLNNVKVQCGNAAAMLNGTYGVQGENLNLKLRLRGTNMPVQDLTALLPAFGATLPKGASLEGGSMNVDITVEGPVNQLVTAGRVDISKTRLVGLILREKCPHWRLWQESSPVSRRKSRSWLRA